MYRRSSLHCEAYQLNFRQCSYVELKRRSGRKKPNVIIALNPSLSSISEFCSVNYRILAVLRARVCLHPVRDVDELRRRVIDSEASSRRSLIQRLIGGDLGWAWVTTRGGQFKQLVFWKFFSITLHYWYICFHTLYGVLFKCWKR